MSNCNKDYEAIALELAVNSFKRKLNSEQKVTSKETIIYKKSKTLYIVKNR